MTEAEEYVKTRDRIAELEGDKQVIEARATAKTIAIELSYRARLEALTKERDVACGAVNGKKQDDVGKIDVVLKELNLSLESTESIMRFLRHKDEVEARANIEIERSTIRPQYQDSTLIWLDDLRKEKYLHIVLLIAENGKPKNKFSLVAYGSCAFVNCQLMRGTYSYSSLHVIDERYDLKDSIKDAPTVEELRTYAAKHRASLLGSFLLEYDETKKAYLEAISKFTMKDFEPALTIREVTEEAAPIVFKLTDSGYDENKEWASDRTTEWRLYKGFYWQRVTKVSADVFSYINIAGITYMRVCRAETLEIRRDSNIYFGGWCSIHIERGTPNERTLFNKENYERYIAETTEWIRKECSTPERFAKVSLSYPKAEWLRPDLLPSFSEG